MFLLTLIQRRVGFGGLSATLDAQAIDAWRTSPDREARSRLFDEIISRNPGATLEFLDEFTTDDLAEYVDHLRSTITPRGRLARWSPKTTTRGICSRAARC